jgi:hypothetical protein
MRQLSSSSSVITTARAFWNTANIRMYQGAAFVICASLVRQFEFAQNVWINDPNFHELGNERDPIIGNQDGTFDLTFPKRPVRKKITGLPAFTTVTGGTYFFCPD